MTSYKTDVCVIAAGPAGLAAAIAAAEGGAEVLVLEKAMTTGGAGNMGMGPLAIGSRLAKKKMVDLTVEKAFKIFMDYTHWRVDARLVREYLSKSADTIEWLEDMGVTFHDVQKYFPSSQATWHVVQPDVGEPGPRAASTMYRLMTQRMTELGVKLMLESPAQRLVMEDGKLTGVVAKKDGEEFLVECKAAILATGGCGDNPEMVKEFTGFTWGTDLHSFRIPGISGDGIRMAWEAGAAHTDINIEMTYSIPALLETPLGDMLFHQPKAVVVNQSGERFMNEELLENVTFAGNAVARQQDSRGYVIVDSSVLKYYIRNGLDVLSGVHTANDLRGFEEEALRMIQAGAKDLYVADSLEELAEQTGIDPEVLGNTIDDYNYGCEEKDDTFFKNKDNLIAMDGPKYFAATMYPGGYGTLGGIKINYKTEVVDPEFRPLKGLYAAGTDACTIFGDSYVFVLPGNTMGFALNSGRMAGEHAADYAMDTEQ
ncbi:FAD-dependent oxidoreductase [Ruminococcaceae bacterium OttesenSCG-928-D13]|nr:FAD-dependent oxidoreductase [Ruminococcaceae bacterium OttesenSCG-928-D13]